MIRAVLPALFPSLFPEPEEVVPDPVLRPPKWRPSPLREPGLPVILGMVGVWIAGMIIAAVVDLRLSIAVFNRQSGWGNFGADFGETPGLLLAVLSTGLLIRLRRFGGTTGQWTLQILGTLVLAFLHLYGAVRIGQELHNELGLVFGIVLALAIPALFFLVSRKNASMVQPIAISVVILAVINPLIVVQLFKTLWGRVRFHTLEPGFGNFTPWLLPQGVTGSRSFPSGHAAMGWMFLPVATLYQLTAYRFRVEATGSAAIGPHQVVTGLIIWVVVLAWGTFVAASRIVVGAHYLSDVLFSTGVAFAITYLLAKLLRTREL